MPETLTIRLSETDRENLQRAADAEGVKLGAYVRGAALSAASVVIGPKPKAPAVRKPPESKPSYEPHEYKPPHSFKKGPRPSVGDLWGR